MTEQIITPWKVESNDGIDYNKLVKDFGANPIDSNLIKRIHKLTNYPIHKWLRRGLFFSHRDLDKFLDAYEKGNKIYIYTGRGPSNKMHLGHCIPFEFTKYLQDAFGAIVIIQLSDDEKYYFRKDDEKNPEFFKNLAYENAKDIIAFGFNPDKTYIFLNSEEITQNNSLMKNFTLMMGNSKGSDIESIFGLTTSNKDKESNTIGQIVWPIFQSIPAFSSSFNSTIFKDDNKKNRYCLIPMAIDQDPYFRLSRDFSQKFGFNKPSCIHSEFLISLLGKNSKMSSSSSQPTLYLTDSDKEICDKIKKYAFSGGGKTLQEHKEFGANLKIDVPYQYLLYFLDDDIELERIANKYKSGIMKTSEIKDILSKCIIDYITKIKLEKEKITQETLFKFFDNKKIFNESLEKKEPIELFDDETYSKMGINFDRYFNLYNLYK